MVRVQVFYPSFPPSPPAVKEKKTSPPSPRPRQLPSKTSGKEGREGRRRFLGKERNPRILRRGNTVGGGGAIFAQGGRDSCKENFGARRPPVSSSPTASEKGREESRKSYAESGEGEEWYSHGFSQRILRDFFSRAGGEVRSCRKWVSVATAVRDVGCGWTQGGKGVGDHPMHGPGTLLKKK